MLESYCICEKGNFRAVNQDSAGTFLWEDKGMFVVADGMGGHYGGDQASRVVLDELTEWWDRCLKTNGLPVFQEGVQQLRQVLAYCHNRISTLAPQGQICGTTVVLLLVHGREYAVFSAGDSRGYMISKRGPFVGKLIQLTHDDVVGPNGPGGSANAGKLLRAIGAGSECLVTLKTGHIPPHTVFALCTDGVHKYCPQNDIATTLKKALRGVALPAVGETITALTEAHGTRDNYSLVLVRC